MGDAVRTYWLTTPCRIRRKDQSLSIEREIGGTVHIPITDVRDLIACDTVDLNTSVVALLNTHRIDLHLLSYYGDYAGSLLTADSQTAGEVVLAQARIASDHTQRQVIARLLIDACAFNVRRVIGRKLLDRSYEVLTDSIEGAVTRDQLMSVEGNYRRTAWAALDTKLPDWLQLAGRNRRPPSNAGNAFISYVNGIIYARALTAIRLTALHSGVGFLHSSMERHRHALALDLAEIFKPLFAERLLLRMAHRGQLEPRQFDTGVNQAMLSQDGRKLVVQTIRDELATTVLHRSLHRNVSYDELIHLEALKLVRVCLEGEPYKPFRIWW